MAGELDTATALPFPLPEGLADQVAVDTREHIVFTDKRNASNHLLLTWQKRNKDIGFLYTIKIAEVDEVARLRANGMRQLLPDEDDMKVRNDAMQMILQAARYGASDLHIMNRGTHAEFQVTVKGGLRVLDKRSHEEGLAIARAIFQGIAKVRGSSYNILEFQSAQVSGDVLPPESRLTSIRIIRGPAYPQEHEGSFMTLRLQYSTSNQGIEAKTEKTALLPLELPRRPEGTFQLPAMGYTPSNIQKLKRLMDAPNGIIIFTGPTGSGKTTGMFEALKEIARSKPHRRLVTAEDPVEYPMEWAVQMAITEARNDSENGEAYSERIRVALRMAPHIILLSELRGPDVAVAALEAAVTGHQVWTTMHVTDPFLFVERLEIMDRQRLAREVFCDHKVVRGVVAARLLPQLCRKCSTPLTSAQTGELDRRIAQALSTWGDLSRVRVKGCGCQACDHHGTTGRFAVVEVVSMDARVMSDFIQHGSDYARTAYRSRPDADPSMLEASIRHVLNGLVDPRDVEENVDLIEPKCIVSAPIASTREAAHAQ